MTFQSAEGWVLDHWVKVLGVITALAVALKYVVHLGRLIEQIDGLRAGLEELKNEHEITRKELRDTREIMVRIQGALGE